MHAKRSLVLLSGLLMLGTHPLPAQDLLRYTFSFSARAFVFGPELSTTNFTWSATRPVSEVFCQSPNSITACRQAVTNSTMIIDGFGTYEVSDLFRIRSRSYANQEVGSVGIEWDGGGVTLFELWNDQLLGHNLGGALSPLESVGTMCADTGIPPLDCFRATSLPFYPITTSGGELRLASILNASYSVSVVPPGTDPATGAPLPPFDPDPDGTIPPFLDCRVNIENCPATAEVLEPDVLLLLTAGFAMLGYAGRRRISS